MEIDVMQPGSPALSSLCAPQKMFQSISSKQCVSPHILEGSHPYSLSNNGQLAVSCHWRAAIGLVLKMLKKRYSVLQHSGKVVLFLGGKMYKVRWEMIKVWAKSWPDSPLWGKVWLDGCWESANLQDRVMVAVNASLRSWLSRITLTFLAGWAGVSILLSKVMENRIWQRIDQFCWNWF